MDCAVDGLLFAAVTHVLVECLLAVRDAVRVCSGFFGLLLLDLLVCLGLGYDVCQELEVLDAGNSVRWKAVSGAGGRIRRMNSPTSRYWIFLLGLRSDLTTLCDCSTRCCRNISVATVITKAALLEQLLMSSSCEMIFLTRATNDVLEMDVLMLACLLTC